MNDLENKTVSELTDEEVRLVMLDHADQHRKAYSYIFEGCEDQILEHMTHITDQTYFGQIMKNTAESGVSREKFNELMSAFSDRYCYILHNENL